MLNPILSVIAGILCGFLSGLGIGGGSLLMVWLTVICATEQRIAQGINLLYYLPAAVCALFFHIKNGTVAWKAVIPCAIAGVLSAIGGAIVSDHVEQELLRRLFGGFLVVVGLVECIGKGLCKKD